jgi:hypothetical protein
MGPIPFSDAALLVPIQVGMMTKIGDDLWSGDQLAVRVDLPFVGQALCAS